MGEALRWLGYLLFAALVCVALVFAFYRLRGPSHAQRDALALMHKDYEPKQGRNAFPLLWFMSYDVRTDTMDAKLRDEVAFVRTRLAETEDPVSYDPPEPKLPEAAAVTDGLCLASAEDCLAEVAKNPGAIRAVLGAFPVMRARRQAFETIDFYWDEFPADYRTYAYAAPPVPVRAERVWISDLALRYANGDTVGALADTCDHIAAWRRIQRGNNSLIMRMAAIAYADGALRLFADMLARMPGDVPAPTECETALRPVEGADLDRCAEMAHEQVVFETTWASVEARSSRPERAMMWLTFEHAQTQAWFAESNASDCGETAVARMSRDEPLRVDRLPQITRRLECIASINGCILADIASPAYANYDARVLDFAAHLRLGATLLWLRDVANDLPLQERFEQRPVALRTGSRKSGIDASGRRLFVDNLYTARSPRFELPLSVHPN
jgi:hypothetical protein